MSYIGGLRWSPDNRKLAVWGANDKGRKGIFLVDHLSGVVSPVTVTGEDFRDPAWSPDGRSLYYRRGSRVLVWDRETGGEKEILPPSWLSINYLALSRDGSKLAMLVEQTLTKSMAVYVMPSAGGKPREILTLPEGISGLVLDWEPSGRNLVFARANNTELWRVPAEGGKPEKIDINMKNIRHVRLHPDGRQIAFSADMGKSEVWALENLLPTMTANK